MYICKCQQNELLNSKFRNSSSLALNMEAIPALLQHLASSILLSLEFSECILRCPSPILVDIFNLNSLNLPSRYLVCRTRALWSVLHACRATTAATRPRARKPCWVSWCAPQAFSALRVWPETPSAQPLSVLAASTALEEALWVETISTAKEEFVFFINMHVLQMSKALLFHLISFKCYFPHRIPTPFLVQMVPTVRFLDCVRPASVSSVLKGSTVTPSSLRSSLLPTLWDSE